MELDGMMTVSNAIDYKNVLIQVQKQRKKYAETIDAFYVDIEAHTEDIVNCSDSKELWNYRDRLEEIRSVLYKLRKSAYRNFGEIKDNYKDSLRVSMSKTQNASGLHFSEREAKYEMQNITEYKILNNMERVVEDLESFSRYLEGKLSWVKDRQRWIQNNEMFGGS